MSPRSSPGLCLRSPSCCVSLVRIFGTQPSSYVVLLLSPSPVSPLAWNPTSPLRQPGPIAPPISTRRLTGKCKALWAEHYLGTIFKFRLIVLWLQVFDILLCLYIEISCPLLDHMGLFNSLFWWCWCRDLYYTSCPFLSPSQCSALPLIVSLSMASFPLPTWGVISFIRIPVHHPTPHLSQNATVGHVDACLWKKRKAPLVNTMKVW